ncbi:MAG: TorD/DmsD family molecular chaperone [Bacillota bacterium]
MTQTNQIHEQRANCYKLLSLCFYQPDAEISAIIGALRKEFNYFSQQAVFKLDEILVELEEHKEDLNYFLADYAKLFVGPFSLLAAPYSSVYLGHERRVMGDSTIEAVNFYQKAGLVINNDLKDAPDHIKVELEFMQYLIMKNIATEDDKFLKLQKEFLLNHLALWIADFKEAVTANSKTILYKNLLEVTRLFISLDQQFLSEKI